MLYKAIVGLRPFLDKCEPKSLLRNNVFQQWPKLFCDLMWSQVPLLLTVGSNNGSSSFLLIPNNVAYPPRLVWIPPHKFVPLPCRYYRVQQIEKYDSREHSNCIRSVANSIQIRLAFLKLNHADRQTEKTAQKVFFTYARAWRTSNNEALFCVG
jgi:hypothetical protein